MRRSDPLAVRLKILEFRFAVETHNTADDHVANLCRGTNSAGSAGRQHESRPDLVYNLPPHIAIGKLRAILRHVGVRLEHDDPLAADCRGPIGAEPFDL